MERTCDSLLMCIVTVLSHGLRSGGGVGDVLRKPSKEVNSNLNWFQVCVCVSWEGVVSAAAAAAQVMWVGSELIVNRACFYFKSVELSQCFPTAALPLACVREWNFKIDFHWIQLEPQITSKRGCDLLPHPFCNTLLLTSEMWNVGWDFWRKAQLVNTLVLDGRDIYWWAFNKSRCKFVGTLVKMCWRSKIK